MIETPFKLTKRESLCSAAATICLQRLVEAGATPRRLGDIAETPQYGYTASASKVPTGTRFLRITDIKAGVVDWPSVPFCECSRASTYALVSGDILVARSGSVGKSFMVETVPEPAVFASYMIRIRVKPGTDTRYVYWCFQSKQFWEQIMGHRRGSAMKNVNGKMLVSLQFPLPDIDTQNAIVTFLETFRMRLNGRHLPLPELPPPLEEQHRVVVRIEELAAKIDEARTLRKQAEEEAEALIPSQTSHVFDELAGYPKAAIRTLGVGGENPVQTGPFGAQLHTSEFVEEGVPVLNVGNVWAEGLRLNWLDHVLPEKAEQLSRYSLNAGDLLFARSGATLGKVCLVPDECNHWLMTGHLFRVRFDQGRIYNRFAFAAFRDARSIHDQVFGQIRGATRPGYNTTLLGNVELPVPPLSEQRRIVSELDSLQAQVDALKALQAETATELDALMPSILDKAFRGEL